MLWFIYQEHIRSIFFHVELILLLQFGIICFSLEDSFIPPRDKIPVNAFLNIIYYTNSSTIFYYKKSCANHGQDSYGVVQVHAATGDIEKAAKRTTFCLYIRRHLCHLDRQPKGAGEGVAVPHHKRAREFVFQEGDSCK